MQDRETGDIGRGDWRTHAAVAVMTAILVGLGIWQLARLQEKQDLLRTIDRNLTQPPVALSELDTGDGTAGEYRPVRVRGAFVPRVNFRIMSRVHEGRLGVHIVSPLEVADGGALILVDRGWAPADWSEPVLPRRPVEVTGLVRHYRAAALLAATNVPEKNEWYWMDRDAMAAAADLEFSGDFYLAALPTGTGGAYPIATAPRINIRNTHLQYALTWFALAVALAVIYILVLRQRRSQPARR